MCVVFNMSARVRFLMILTKIMCNPVDDPFDPHSISETAYHLRSFFVRYFPSKQHNCTPYLKQKYGGENCNSGVGWGVSYTREIVKFNDFKAISRVRVIRGGGQYARK